MVYAEEKDKVFLNIYKIKTIKTKQNQETSFTFQLCISYYYEIIAFFNEISVMYATTLPL